MLASKTLQTVDTVDHVDPVDPEVDTGENRNMEQKIKKYKVFQVQVGQKQKQNLY